MNDITNPRAKDDAQAEAIAARNNEKAAAETKAMNEDIARGAKAEEDRAAALRKKIAGG